MAVAPREVLGLAVAVRAEHLEVLEPVVRPVAVDVVQRHRQRPPEPLVDPAHLATVLLQARADQALLDMVATAGRRQKLTDRHAVRPRPDLPALLRLVPALPGEAELQLALRDAVAGVVIRLDRVPVVAPRTPFVDGPVQAPRMPRDGALRPPRAPRHLRLRQPLPQEAPDLFHACWHEHMFANAADGGGNDGGRPEAPAVQTLTRLPGRDSNPKFDVQSVACCRLHHPAVQWAARNGLAKNSGGSRRDFRPRPAPPSRGTGASTRPPPRAVRRASPAPRCGRARARRCDRPAGSWRGGGR